MAKGNLFLGTAARSVGDVVMYRREGSQVSRVRVRKIANPKTDAQCEQRAFMSAVVKFYQPLANVLDRSWQGLSRAKSYAKFLKTNVGIVRAGGYYIPKDAGFTPLPLQLSNGTLPSFVIGYVDPNFYIAGNFSNGQGGPVETIGDLSAMLIEIGAQNGDVFTVICVNGSSDKGYQPKAIQFVIDSTSEVTTASIFGANAVQNVTVAGGRGIGFKISDDQVAFSAIIARNVDGEWKRSKQSLFVDADTLATFTTNEAKAAAIASYKGAAASDNPLVYLDGDELQ